MSNDATILEMPINDFIEKIKEQFPIWFEKMNLVVGLTSFSLAIVAIKTDYPEIIAWSSFVIVIGVTFSIRHHFPKDLKLLRKKKGKSNLEIIILKGIEVEYLGFGKIIVHGFIFWFGLFSLVAVGNGFKTVFLIKILPVFTN